MDYKLKKLNNGLRLLTVEIPGMESSTIMVWTRVGSRNETKKISGISHFLEHMVFKGTRKRPSPKEVAMAIDALGGEANAGTTKEWTSFYIKARNEVLPVAFDILSDIVINPLLKEKDIEKEKGVILEEMAMYEDTPQLKIHDIFENLIFSNTSLGRDIIGSQKSVKGIDRSDFLEYKKRHYSTNNFLITVTGGFKEKEALKLAEKYFGGLKKIDREKMEEFKTKQEKPKVLLSSKRPEQAHFFLGFLGGQLGNEDRLIESVLATLMGRGMSSRLFTEVRENRGLAYAVMTSMERYLDTGYMATYAGVDPKKVDEAIKVTLDEHYHLASSVNKISEEELSKAKEYIKGHLALSLEDTKQVGYFFGIRELLLEKVETPEDVFKGVDEVSIDDVLRVAKKLFVPEKLNLAIIGPYKDQERFEKLLK